MELETRTLPAWARAFAIVVGFVSLLAGFLVVAFPRLGLLVVVYFIAFALILLGLERLAMGITGHAYAARKKEQTST